MRTTVVYAAVLAAFATTAIAQEATWRKDVQPIIAQHCAACHGARQPEFAEWMVQRETNKSLAPRMDTYTHFMDFVVWPATGAVMRRLDDGKGAPGAKPGNMYHFLGGTDEERARNLQTIKSWLGDGAWNLNRWEARGGTPGITKEQLDKVKAKY